MSTNQKRALVTGGAGLIGSHLTDLLVGEGGVRVGGREVAHQSDDVPCRLDELGEPVATHPGVELEVHAHALRNLAVRDDDLEIRVARLGDLAARVERPHAEDARGGELLPQLERFQKCRDAESACARTERRAGYVDRAVPVCVGLDDRPELRALERTQQRPDVSPERAEVDSQLGAVHQSNASGSASTTSPATSPRSRTRAARR